MKKVGRKPDPNNSRELWLQFINADSEEEFEMISQTNVPIMKKAVNVIYDMSEDTKIREIARLREKALHDEASALKNAKAEGKERLVHGSHNDIANAHFGGTVPVRQQVERQALAHAAAERQRVDRDGDENQKQHRHEHLGGFLDAVLDAAHDDRHAQHEQQRRVENDLTRVDGERADDARVAAEGVERVLRCPAAEHGVVADDERGDHDRHEAAPAEIFVDHLVVGHGVCLRAAAVLDLA